MENKEICTSEVEGEEVNLCEDYPITYCRKCERFYVLDGEGNREQVNLQLKQNG